MRTVTFVTPFQISVSAGYDVFFGYAFQFRLIRNQVRTKVHLLRGEEVQQEQRTAAPTVHDVAEWHVGKHGSALLD
jgi:hypothetical protein